MPTLRKTTNAFEGIAGIGLIIFLCVYVYLIRKELCASIQRTNGFLAGQIWYILGVIATSISYIVNIFYRYHTAFDGSLTILTNGLSGYFTAIAYCFIFFSWTAICAENVSLEFADFYKKSSRIMYGLAIGVGVAFVVTFFLTLFGDSSLYGNSCHTAESCVAVVRDLALCTAFVIYHRKLRRLSEPPYYFSGKPESKLFLTCLVLIIALPIRAFSILMYCFYWASWRIIDPDPMQGNYPDNCVLRQRGLDERECSFGYFGEYIVEQIVCEIMPIVWIGITKIMQTREESQLISDENGLDFTFTDPHYLIYDQN